MAAEYGRVTSEAIRRTIPNHMVLGCRFADYPGDIAMRAVAPYFDVISYHSYTPDAPVERLRQITELTGRPTMVTEFSFKAMDSGLPNTKGAAKPVATQQDRANGFAGYVEALASLAGCVGFHWFEYRDEPKEGRRLDGENSNYGRGADRLHALGGSDGPHAAGKREPGGPARSGQRPLGAC